jgi:hypothetical protein
MGHFTKKQGRAVALGTTSQAYNATRYSLLCYRAPSFNRGRQSQVYETLFKWEKRLHLTRKNTVTLLQRKLLGLSKWRSKYYIFPLEGCEDIVTDYIRYERKNHPAKKGKNRQLTDMDEMDEINKTLYPPNGIPDIQPQP